MTKDKLADVIATVLVTPLVPVVWIGMKVLKHAHRPTWERAKREAERIDAWLAAQGEKS